MCGNGGEWLVESTNEIYISTKQINVVFGYGVCSVTKNVYIIQFYLYWT